MTDFQPLKKRIGRAVINALPPNTIVWDTDLKGFCARRQSGEGISYQLKTRVNGRIRWFTIGRHGQPWTPDAARRQALQILANPSMGEKSVERERTPRFAAVAEDFLAIHGAKQKPRTREEQARIVRLYLNPAFGSMELAKISRVDVEAAHAKWHATPRAANHALAVMSTLMNWAEERGFRPEDTNPCRRIKHYRQNNRERYLQPEELARLGSALDQAASDNSVGPYAIAAIKLLIFTGARLSEILTLQWSFVDIDRRKLLLPDSKTGQKTIPLNDEAIAVLKQLPRFANNPFVIVGFRHASRLINLQKPWRRVRKLAGLDDVRLHDLRHTFASVAVAAGGSLPIIGRALGHSQPATTARYAHLTDDPVRQLTQSTGTALAAAMRKGSSASS